MFKKTATAAGVALAGVALLLSAPGLAYADELPPEPAVEESSAPVEAPAAETEPAPVEEPAPVDVDPYPEEPTPDPVVDPYPPTPTPETKTLKWTLPDGGTPGNVTWPQPVFDSSAIPCGTSVWVQVDVYPYTTPEDKARTDALDDDGILTYGEDHGWVKSWSFEQYSAPACIPVLPPAPTVELVGSCGLVSATLTNPQQPGTIGQTASFVVNVDGEFYGAYSVPADGSQVLEVPFSEDSGDHLVEVYQAGLNEWALIGEKTVSSDCVIPEPETPVTPETPIVPETPVTPALQPAPAPVTPTLAETGSAGTTWLLTGLSAAAAAALGLVLTLTRRARRG